MYENLDWKEILRTIEGFATSALVKARVLETSAFSSAMEATEKLQQVRDAQKIFELGSRPHAQSLDLFMTWYERLTKNAVLKPLEFRDVRHFCLEVLTLEEILKAAGKNAFASLILENLLDARQPLSAIEQILTPDGEIRTDASERLYKLYRDKQDKEREIRSTLDKIVKSHDMETILQEKYVTNREGRWVLPVRSGMRHDIDGIIHDMSQTKQTVFIEPQAVVQINNQLRQLEAHIQEEIERLLKELSHYLSGLCADFIRSKKYLELADQRFAEAQFAKSVEATQPEFHSQRLKLNEVRHPLLSLKLTPDKVVANNVLLDENHSVLLLSGPNAGGKTVLLKSIGLAAHMARCGLPICAASGSQIPFFSDILAAVGDSQSVDQHLSTFAAHLKALSQALTFKGHDKMILIDEICGSTDPEEGAALARSFIESYAKNGAYVVVTSHLGPLKVGWEEQTQVVSGSMDFDDKSSQPTYQLVMGMYGRSLAIKTAKKVGVPLEVVERALELMGPEAKARDNKMTELEEQKQELSHLKEQFFKLTQEAKETKHRYAELVEKFKKQRDEWLKKAIDQAERKIENIYAEVRKETNRSKTVHDFKSMLPEIVKTPAKITIESADDFAKVYAPGSTVFVKSLGQDAVVQGTPNSKGEVPILSNSMRLFVHWTNLTAPRSPQNPMATVARRVGVHSVSLQNEDREIDLRGQRVEEALELLETELDTAVRNKEERIKVIHGHGTEALKKALRSYFSRSVYIKKWKAGDQHTGGDGITWIELE